MRLKLLIALVLTSGLLLSCIRPSGIVTIWTDRGETAIYADIFNSMQNNLKVEIVYFENAAEMLLDNAMVEKKAPDIVIASFLNSERFINLFLQVPSYYKPKAPLNSIFYPALIEAGRHNKKQLLLPVSFDVYAVIFNRNKSDLPTNAIYINPEDIRRIASDYNVMQNGTWSKIGFSPLWNDEFLFLYTRLAGTDWAESVARENIPLSWNDEILEKSIDELREWIISSNNSIEADEEFSFKYIYEPLDKLAARERILFAFSKMSDFRKIEIEKQNQLDFRLLENNGKIYPTEDVVYYGVHKNSHKKRAAKVFTSWFFNVDTQELFLKKSKETRLNELSFGIMDGYSAMTSVTINSFPKVYTEALRYPPVDKITNPGVLPSYFTEIKERLIIPYIVEKTREGQSVKTHSLELRWASR